jgi:hypothetical protein
MASFDKVNYSLRPSKTIERALAFEGVATLQKALDLREQVYIGFGSIWFTDFQIAHKSLRISDLISIEKDEIGYARAKFNAPYKTVRVRNQHSKEALRELIDDAEFNLRPWVIWLDYDSGFTDSTVDDIRAVVEGAPTNSIFLITFDTSAVPSRPKDRLFALREAFGALVPDDLLDEDVDERLPETLAKLASDLMVSTAVQSGRPGGFLPCFNMVYRDTATMMTVGGILPAPAAIPAAREAVQAASWPALVTDRIVAPHLTIKEAATLQAQLPRPKPLTRAAIRRLGFDLNEDQLAIYERYYLYYPSFAQVSF